MSKSIDIINKLYESADSNPRHLELDGFGAREHDFKSVEEITSKYDTFAYQCYHCGVYETYNMEEFIEKQRGFGLDDEEIVELFNNPYGLLCNDCADEE